MKKIIYLLTISLLILSCDTDNNEEDAFSDGGDRQSELINWADNIISPAYHNFNETKDTTLDLLHCPVSQDLIINNRLLDIKANHIHFMFEEPQGEIL